MSEKPLTAMQLRALRIIQQRPGMTAQDLAYELTTHRKQITDADRLAGRRGLDWPQAATRWGSQYAMRLIRKGLLAKEPHHGGWAKLSLTPKGRAAIGLS